MTYQIDMVNAVLLAGTPADKRHLIYGQNKAVNIIMNRPVFEYVLDALYDSKKVISTYLVGPEKISPKVKLEDYLSNYQLTHPGKDIYQINESTKPTDRERILENILNGYAKAKSGNDGVLFIPADIPLVKSSHIDEFVEQVHLHDSQSPKDLYYCYTDNLHARRVFYQSLRKGLKTIEGEFRAANLALAMNDNLGKKKILAKCFQDSRKLIQLGSQLKLFYNIGFLSTIHMVGKYIAGTISLRDIESYVCDALSTRFKLIPSSHPELEYDIDKEIDHVMVSRILEMRKRR